MTRRNLIIGTIVASGVGRCSFECHHHHHLLSIIIINYPQNQGLFKSIYSKLFQWKIRVFFLLLSEDVKK